MNGDGLISATRFLVIALSLLYVMAAIVGLMLVDFDSAGDVVVWLSFLGVGAALMLVGQLVTPVGRLSAALVSAGAALGGLPLVWTLIVPVAVAAVVACSIAVARSHASAPA